MKRSLFFILANSVIMAMVLALLLQSLLVINRVAEVESLSKQIQVQSNSDKSVRTLGADSSIHNGDVLFSGANDRATLKWIDGTRVQLQPNTQFGVRSVRYNALTKAETHDFRLEWGEIWLRTTRAPAPGSTFEVETPLARITVKGAVCHIQSAPNATTISVYKGRLQLSASDTSRELAEGDIAVVKEGASLQVTGNSTVTAPEKFARPQLTAGVSLASDNARVLIRGTTEAGNTVMVNGRALRVLGNGIFRHFVQMGPGRNIFTIVCTDRFGVTTSLVRTLDHGPVIRTEAPDKTPAPACQSAYPLSPVR
jgi:hypothetical protein